MIHEQLIAAIEEMTESMLLEGKLARPEKLVIALEHPVNLEHGDYSSNIAMQLAKLLKRAPAQIAGEFQQKLQSHPLLSHSIAQIEVASPGFLNFYVDWSWWAAASEQTSTSKTALRNKVLVEHTSINPNKSAHIGHLRNSCIGDTLARMLTKTGCQVEVHNYIDDLGNQLADTVVGVLQTTTKQPYERFGDFCWETYSKINKAYKENPDLLEQRTSVLTQLEEGHSNVAWMGLLIAERIVREHVEEMKQFGISYDVLVWESSIVREGFWERAFELLQKTSIFRKETEGKLAGCWVLKHQEHEADETNEYQTDKVLVRSNGILTYTAKDIAYHLWKFGLLDKDFRYKRFSDRLWSTHASGAKKKIGHADMVINVIDQRQEYPQAMVKQALLALGYEQQAEQLRHVSYGVVSLSANTAKGLGIDTSEGKHAYAMSGRQGIGIKIADFLVQMEQIIDGKRSRKAGITSHAIAAASIRYYLLRFQLQTEIVFDIDQATEVSGNTGVYMLYSYARSCSILQKAGEGGRSLGWELALGELEPAEHQLLRQLAYWPETLQAAVKELSPSLLCSYVYDLSALFNHFYAVCPILKAEGQVKTKRIWLTERYKQAMQEALEILGLPTPSRM
ncbi:arginine--tRNA ligase [Paenibacillus sp. FSL H8-0548]|uniref:arginine--tRNA ligase n=1 Tax=Paenibacillus sp. FSL H8-0548 TaxID=1920422 RepID=UPI00096F026D|nr:arginine--tRNA ligase [Paenibacillus sp. FSL H8-0548]OMF24811.1 arginine--tRNA ligase [Paenibacillus sp. FSL H8-0548]